LKGFENSKHPKSCTCFNIFRGYADGKSFSNEAPPTPQFWGEINKDSPQGWGGQGGNCVTPNIIMLETLTVSVWVSRGHLGRFRAENDRNIMVLLEHIADIKIPAINMPSPT